MNHYTKQSRTPLLNALRKAFHIAERSTFAGSPPVDELIGQYEQDYLKRRRFIGNTLKAGVAIGAANILNACSKVVDVVPPAASEHKLASRQSSQPEIVIVGAGMAGLNCAYQLKKAGYTSTVYEGSSRIGGRIFTRKNILAPGLTTELGGEFIDSEHTALLQLCQEFNLPLIDTEGPSEAGLIRDSFYIGGKFYSETEVIKAFLPYAAQIRTDINSLPDIMTYDNHDATTVYFDNLSISAYLNSIGMYGFIRKGIEVAYLTEYGLETDVQSSINFLYLFSPDTKQGFKIFGSSDERYKILGGNHKVTQALYSRLQNQVIMEHKLVQIKETPNGYILDFENANNTTVSVHADMVVMAIPFTTLRTVQLQITLPAWKTNAIQNLGYGTNAKLLLGFDTAVWRNYQYNGYAFTDKSIQNGWDNSVGQPGGSAGYTIYQGGNKGIDLGNGSPESQLHPFLYELNHMWPGAYGAFNGNVHRMHWPTYPFTRGSYACYTTGQYTTIRGAEIKHIRQLYFAGEHCSSFYQGFMNGAVETGAKAAKKMVQAIEAGQSIVTN